MKNQPIEGVVFEVRDKDGKVLDTLTTDKNGHAESKELPICTYNEDGSFKEDIHYTVVETKAADGYILDETAHDVTLSMYRQSLSFHRQATMQIRFFILELVHLHLLQVLESDFVEERKRINSNN